MRRLTHAQLVIGVTQRRRRGRRGRDAGESPAAPSSTPGPRAAVQAVCIAEQVHGTTLGDPSSLVGWVFKLWLKWRVGFCVVVKRSAC